MRSVALGTFATRGRGRKCALILASLLWLSSVSLVSGQGSGDEPPDPVVFPDPSCDVPRCYSRQTMPVGGTVPSNYRILLDGRRYDPGRLVVRYSDTQPSVRVAASAREIEHTAETGVYEVAIEDPEHPVPNGTYFVGAPHWDAFGYGTGSGASITMSDEEDTSPPVAEGLRFEFEHIFTNECGAKAVLVQAERVTDSQSEPIAMPLLVKLESDSGTHYLWTSIHRAGSGFQNAWVHDGPYFQDCIGTTGIESLELSGEVRATFTLFDHAGNAAEPITQVVQWPKELGPANPGTDAGPADGGAGGAAAGNPDSGGCSVGGRTPWRGAWLLLVVWVLMMRIRKIRFAGG